MRSRVPAFVTVLLVSTLILVEPAEAAPELVVDGRDRVLAGVYSDQWWSKPDLDNLGDASGKRISLSGTFHTVVESADVTAWILEQSWRARSTPVANVTVPSTAAEIVFGLADPEIRTWAENVKAWLDRGDGRSLMIAPLQEMNGVWTPYSIDPGSYKKAYGKFVSTFRELGVDETQVRWVFAPNGWSTPPFRMADYYPGASTVDLVGISAYNWGSLGSWTDVHATLDGAVAEARSFAKDKPFLLAQVGSAPGGGDRDAWVRDLFAYAAADPNIVGLVYFNINVPSETDWRVWDGMNASRGWREGMALPGTVEGWPLTGWFQRGPLPFATPVPPGDRFHDDDDSPFERAIEWMAAEGITFGCNPPANDHFCPDRPVTREEMASFLVRALQLPVSADDRFIDDDDSLHQPDIAALHQAGITTGCGPGLFCPEREVSRQEMASFLARGLGLPPGSGDWFTDDDGSLFEPDIDSLRQAGITLGCGPTSFCPHDPVTRGQMAAFLHRALEGRAPAGSASG